MTHLDLETDGKQQAYQDFFEGQPPLYLRKPKYANRVMKRIKDDVYKDIGYMSEHALAAGYVLGWEAMKKVKYPKHLQPIRTMCLQHELRREGHKYGLQARKENTPCLYRIDHEGHTWERQKGCSLWTASAKSYPWVRGYLSGYQGEMTYPHILNTAVQLSEATSAVLTPAGHDRNSDEITAAADGFQDGWTARGVYQSLSDVRAPYVFKNRQLFAVVVNDSGRTRFEKITDPVDSAYAKSFIKAWKKCAKQYKPFAKVLIKTLAKHGKPKQISLPFIHE